MGLVYADFKLVNYYTKQSVDIRALVDTGTTGAFVTWEVARQLGFDPEEVSVQHVTVADGRRIAVPRLVPVEIHFQDRHYTTEVCVLGEECLIGAIPLEFMDLVVDPGRRAVIPNPAHPDGPCLRAGSAWPVPPRDCGA
jgi:clan AA aspartic protease